MTAQFHPPLERGEDGGVSGDAIAHWFGAIPLASRPGTLWERASDRGEGLEVFSGWLVWAEDDCGKCAGYGYGCPPGSHMQAIRQLTWRCECEHYTGQRDGLCKTCGKLVLS